MELTQSTALILGLAPVVLMALAYAVHLVRAGRAHDKKDHSHTKNTHSDEE